MAGEEGRLPRLLTTKQLAKATGLPVWRVHELALGKSGPPFLRVGRTRRYPEDAVVRWIQEKSHTLEEE